MFETGIHVWLQSIRSDLLAALLTGVSLLGYVPTYAVLIIAFVFGVRLAPGMAVLGAVVLTEVVTETAKEVVAFPRPDQVDDRLMRTYASGDVIVSRGGAPTFWSLPTREAIEKVRASKRGNYGFPSGHVSAATAFLVCTAWFMRARWLYGLTLVWIPLMGLSRMYLGRHFLADVLGGLVIALVVSATWIRWLPAQDPVDTGPEGRRLVRRLWFVALGLLALTPWWNSLPPAYVGAVTGLALSYSLIVKTGSPRDGGTSGQRAARIAIALTLFAVTLGIMALAFGVEGASRWSLVFSGAVVTASTFAGTILLSRRLGLFEAVTPQALPSA
ncbi:MAG: phosphatase PAP2 family protein [Vicinamibacteria bacterium]